MLESIFTGLFDTSSTNVISVGNFLLCLVVSLVLGVILALAYSYKTERSNSFLFTVGLLPAVVCVVIMMVNGNIGAGVAVAGAFGLVRFRSAPGTGREIAVLFLAMGTGLIAGMGYLGYAALFTIIMAIIVFAYNQVSAGGKKQMERVLTVTIPEDVDYAALFDDLFASYASSAKLMSSKTTNGGSLYKLKYNIVMKDASKEKELIDQMRCRNGNLEISMSIEDKKGTEL